MDFLKALRAQSTLRLGPTLAVLDVETGGLNPRLSGVVSIAIIVDGEEFYSKVKPELPVAPAAAAVNGYNCEEWASAPTFAEIAPRVKALLSGRHIIGHNVSFDMDFIRAEFSRAGIPFAADLTIDTLSMALQLWPGRAKGKHTLVSVCSYLGVNYPQAHNALADARVTRCAYFLMREALAK